ncbi:ImmA/IrrE family metallo-endopeptidase [Priestia megaterium]|uniref:ImmA/IrrE family metallo-endopeptidase n=1 Tax=Priestia megaterium TaxID=1404 RepID=UPI001F52B13C|nr:ImmA/IrrE family metallo-endopeptidase [Priestia megaterium]
MTMTMMMISKTPNFRKAEQAAFQLLKINNVQELPVKVKKLSNHFSNLRIKSYSWFAKKRNMTLEEVCEFANSDEGCCWYKKSTNKYVILYNDTVENVGRIRWTIAHELGHFMLKHNEMSNKSVYARNSLTQEEYEVFEKEANCFARNLLAPPQIVYELRPENPHILSDLFNISFEAATNVFIFFNNGLERGISYSKNHFIFEIFKGFILRYKHGKTCTNCSNYFVTKDALFCPICGQDRLIKREGDDKMIYSGYDIDENSRAKICPKCDNEQLENGDYCKACGVYVINKCANREWYNNEITWECGTLLDGNARFCTACGHQSTFFQSRLLASWDVEKRAREEEEELYRNIVGQEVPF